MLVASYKDVPRLPDWERRFSAFLRASRAVAPEWGQTDCLVGLVAGTLEAVLGEDPAAEHRGTYASRLDAMRYLAELGFPTIADWLSHALEEIAPARAGRADIVTVEGAPAVVIGNGDAWLNAHGVAGRAEQRTWGRAWRVGA